MSFSIKLLNKRHPYLSKMGRLFEATKNKKINLLQKHYLFTTKFTTVKYRDTFP